SFHPPTIQCLQRFRHRAGLQSGRRASEQGGTRATLYSRRVGTPPANREEKTAPPSPRKRQSGTVQVCIRGLSPAFVVQATERLLATLDGIARTPAKQPCGPGCAQRNRLDVRVGRVPRSRSVRNQTNLQVQGESTRDLAHPGSTTWRFRSQSRFRRFASRPG